MIRYDKQLFKVTHGMAIKLKYTTGWWCNNHLETYEFVNRKDDIPYMKWKITKIFETTNQ